jgi:transcription initiation factor TFIID subunit 2
MTAKLAQGLYKDRFEFEADFRLMVNNAKQYNLVGSGVHNEAIALETLFEKRGFLHFSLFVIIEIMPGWTRINKTLEAAAAQQPAPEAPPPPPTPAPEVQPPTLAADATPSPKDALSTSSRPTIKLKVGANQSKPAEAPKPAAKPRARKPKVVDAPPPPYVDDGSHDLLQEVIAMELEKAEEKLNRQRSTSVKEKDREKEKVVENGTPKRKQASISGDEDEILALATPAKKERPSPAGPSNSKDPSIALTKKPTFKQKKPKLAEPSLPADAPQVSIKGKEREIIPVSPLKPKKPPTAQAPTPINDKKCKDLLKTLLKLPEAAIFTRPVDPVIDGCPT